MRRLSLALVFCLAASTLSLPHSNSKEKEHIKSHEQKAEKQRHNLGHRGEHWSGAGTPTRPASASASRIKDVLKHAPGAVPAHESRIQAHLESRGKHASDRHQEDIHLQDLMMEESVRHHEPIQKLLKPHPTAGLHANPNANRKQKVKIAASRQPPTDWKNWHHRLQQNHGQDRTHSRSQPESAAVHVSSHAGQNKNFHSMSKQTKGQKEKKFPKKFNPTKHEKKSFNKANVPH